MVHKVECLLKPLVYKVAKIIPAYIATANFTVHLPCVFTLLPSQVNLGNMYYNGLGVAQDKAKAKELYKMAADKDKNAKALLEELEIEEQKENENSGKAEEKT